MKMRHLLLGGLLGLVGCEDKVVEETSPWRRISEVYGRPLDLGTLKTEDGIQLVKVTILENGKPKGYVFTGMDQRAVDFWIRMRAEINDSDRDPVKLIRYAKAGDTSYKNPLLFDCAVNGDDRIGSCHDY